MLGFVVLAAAIVATGTGLARALYRRYESETPSPLELIVAGSVTGLALWMAANWILALTHTLTRPALLALGAAFLLAAIALWWREVPRFRLQRPSLLLLPLFLWTAFMLWRGTVVPPVNHDALSYHLPKAVLFVRAHGFPTFAGFDHRFPSFPANYELLVADLFLLHDSDRLTEWIGTASFLLLLAATALLAKRWWGSGPHVALSVIATAAAPVVLLHSGADKNDLLTQFFVLTALLWGTIWSLRGGVVPTILFTLSLALAVGTKTNAGAIAAGLFPFFAWRVLRHRFRPLPALGTVVFGIAAFLLCGGAVFVAAVQRDELMGVQIGSASIGKPLYSYTKWENLWRVPLRFVTAGIDSGANERDVLFSSHFGPLFTVLVVALPFALWRYRAAGRERLVALAAAVLAFFVILPTYIHPPAMPRYALFLLPLVVILTIAPVTRELLSAPRTRRPAFALIGVLLLIFVQQAADAAINDAACPLRYVLETARHPTRQPPHLHARGSLAVDRLAGPNDTIAMLTDVSGWIYPLFGEKLTRPLIMLRDDATPDTIPPAADWVVIERWWHAGDARTQPLYVALARDARFRLEFENRSFAHSVFRRVSR